MKTGILRKLHQDSEGFTLVELMIVVAIIGILAAIAIPQFAAYRIRGFNSSAQSDAKNLATSQNAMMADWQTYGTSQSTAGNLIFTPAASVGGALNIACVGGDPNADGIGITLAATARGVAISVGNNVTAISNTDVPAPAGNPAGTFTLATKHLQGDTVYGMESDSTSVFSCQVSAAANACEVAVGTALAASPAAVINAVDFPAAGGWVVK